MRQKRARLRPGAADCQLPGLGFCGAQAGGRPFIVSGGNLFDSPPAPTRRRRVGGLQVPLEPEIPVLVIPWLNHDHGRARSLLAGSLFQGSRARSQLAPNLQVLLDTASPCLQWARLELGRGAADTWPVSRWLRKAEPLGSTASHLVATSRLFRPWVDQPRPSPRPWYRSRAWGTSRLRTPTTRTTGAHPNRIDLSSLPRRRGIDYIAHSANWHGLQAAGAAGAWYGRLSRDGPLPPLRRLLLRSVLVVALPVGALPDVVSAAHGAACV